MCKVGENALKWTHLLWLTLNSCFDRMTFIFRANVNPSHNQWLCSLNYIHPSQSDTGPSLHSSTNNWERDKTGLFLQLLTFFMDLREKLWLWEAMHSPTSHRSLKTLQVIRLKIQLLLLLLLFFHFGEALSVFWVSNTNTDTSVNIYWSGMSVCCPFVYLCVSVHPLLAWCVKWQRGSLEQRDNSQLWGGC